MNVRSLADVSLEEFYKLFRYDSILSINQTIADHIEGNKWSKSAQRYHIAEGLIFLEIDRKPYLAITNGRTNPILREFEAACETLRTRLGYAPSPSCLEEALTDKETILVDLSLLRFSNYRCHYKCYEDICDNDLKVLDVHMRDKGIYYIHQVPNHYEHPKYKINREEKKILDMMFKPREYNEAMKLLGNTQISVLFPDDCNYLIHKLGIRAVAVPAAVSFREDEPNCFDPKSIDLYIGTTYLRHRDGSRVVCGAKLSEHEKIEDKISIISKRRRQDFLKEEKKLKDELRTYLMASESEKRRNLICELAQGFPIGRKYLRELGLSEEEEKRVLKAWENFKPDHGG